VTREQLIARHARGRSFADIGAMWNVEGALAIHAKRSGATDVTAMDLMPPTSALADAGVRFVQGDLHDPDVIAEVGAHDVVWCSGVLYHAPHPLLTLERLRSITRETLLLATETIPLPGRFAAFAPGRGFDARRGYGNWWWLPTPATVRAMLEATGFEIVEKHRRGALNRTFVAIPS
jgi:hypothetical protein